MWYELLVGGVSSITIFSLFISVPLYILVLVAVKRNRTVEPFNSEFFSIFIVLGVVDITCYLIFLIKKLIFLGVVPDFLKPVNQTNELCSYLYYPFWVLGFLQYQLNFILTMNRHFSIVSPLYYMQQWNPKFTRFLITSSVIFTCTLCLPIIFADVQISEYVAFRDERAVTLRYGPHTTTRYVDYYFKVVWAAHVYGLIASSVIFYGMMIKKLRDNVNILVGKKRKIELQMFYIGFSLFALNCIFSAYFFLRDLVLVQLTKNPHLHEWILYFLADIYDLPNGYILWFTSPRIRKIVYHMLGLENGLFKNGGLVFSTASTRATARVSQAPAVETEPELSPPTISSNKF